MVKPKAEKTCLLTSVADSPEANAEAILHGLLDRGWYVFSARTPGLSRLKPEDRLCFYKGRTGIVAAAIVASIAEKRPPDIAPPDAHRFPWAVRVKDVRYFFDKPVPLDDRLRGQLEAFRGKDPAGPWAWFVQSARLVTEHDFKLLVGH
jgi:hypothetical protein